MKINEIILFYLDSKFPSRFGRGFGRSRYFSKIIKIIGVKAEVKRSKIKNEHTRVTRLANFARNWLILARQRRGQSLTSETSRIFLMKNAHSNRFTSRDGRRHVTIHSPAAIPRKGALGEPIRARHLRKYIYTVDTVYYSHLATQTKKTIRV